MSLIASIVRGVVVYIALDTTISILNEKEPVIVKTIRNIKFRMQ